MFLLLIVISVFVLILFTYLPESQIKKKIYSNKFFHNSHLSEFSFICPKLRASGLGKDCYNFVNFRSPCPSDQSELSSFLIVALFNLHCTWPFSLYRSFCSNVDQLCRFGPLSDLILMWLWYWCRSNIQYGHHS